MANTTEETPLYSDRGDSPLRFTPDDSESTGYSTDYSTFEIGTQRRSTTTAAGFSRDALPDRSGGSRSSYSNYPGRARQPASNAAAAAAVGPQELLVAGTDGNLAQDGGPDQSPWAPVHNNDGEGEDEEKEEKEDMMRDEPHLWPSAMNCFLVPSCAIRYCK